MVLGITSTRRIRFYANKKEVAEVFKAVGVQFPITREAVSNVFGFSIKTDEDLVKLKMQHETLYHAAWHGSPYLTADGDRPRTL